MPVKIIYVLFFVYVLMRIYFSINYYLIKNSFKQLHFEREQDPTTKDSFIDEDGFLLNPKDSQKNWNEHPTTKKILETEERWRRLHIYDIRTKRIGSIFLAIISLVGVWITYNNGNQQSILIAILPGIVGMFNTAFEWIEIKLPFELHKMIVPFE